jgi:hypothetical protein
VWTIPRDMYNSVASTDHIRRLRVLLHDTFMRLGS